MYFSHIELQERQLEVAVDWVDDKAGSSRSGVVRDLIPPSYREIHHHHHHHRRRRRHHRGDSDEGDQRNEKISNSSSFGIIDIAADSSTSDRIIVIVDTACFIHDGAYR